MDIRAYRISSNFMFKIISFFSFHYFIVPLGVPHMLAKDITINGYTVPKGTMLLANQQAIHFDNKYWDEPTKFKPERFLDVDGTIKKTDKLIPFSIGWYYYISVQCFNIHIVHIPT